MTIPRDNNAFFNDKADDTPLTKEGSILKNFFKEGVVRYDSDRKISLDTQKLQDTWEMNDNAGMNRLGKFLIHTASDIAQEYSERIRASKRLREDFEKLLRSFNKKYRADIKRVFNADADLGLCFNDRQISSLYFLEGTFVSNQRTLPLKSFIPDNSDYGIFHAFSEFGRVKSLKSFYIQLVAVALCHEIFTEKKDGSRSMLSSADCSYIISKFLDHLPSNLRPKYFEQKFDIDENGNAIRKPIIDVDAVNELLDVNLSSSPIFIALLKDYLFHQYPFSLTDLYRRNRKLKINSKFSQKENATLLKRLIAADLDTLSDLNERIPFGTYGELLKMELGSFDAEIINSDLLKKWS